MGRRSDRTRKAVRVVHTRKSDPLDELLSDDEDYREGDFVGEAWTPPRGLESWRSFWVTLTLFEFGIGMLFVLVWAGFLVWAILL